MGIGARGGEKRRLGSDPTHRYTAVGKSVSQVVLRMSDAAQ